MRLPIIAATVLLAGCATAGSDVRPALVPYRPAFQARAGDELDALPPACPPDRAGPGCSALRVMIEDYGALQAQLR